MLSSVGSRSGDYFVNYVEVWDYGSLHIPCIILESLFFVRAKDRCADALIPQ
jgi:hypothetical protein